MKQTKRVESYFKNEEEQNFVRKTIEHDVLCLVNQWVEDSLKCESMEDFTLELIDNLTYPVCSNCYNKIDEEDKENALCAYCEKELNLEDEYNEIFQWFIVTEWLAEKLRQEGQPILEAGGVHLWGRTCCGQAIELDGTFQRIYRALNNEE